MAAAVNIAAASAAETMLAVIERRASQPLLSGFIHHSCSTFRAGHCGSGGAEGRALTLMSCR